MISGDKFFKSKNEFVSCLRVYSELTGSRYVYGFFTPRLAVWLRLRIDVNYLGSRASETFILDEITPYQEARHRVEAIVYMVLRYSRKDGPLPLPPLKKHFISFVAETALAKYPGAKSATVHYERYEPLTYDEPRRTKDWEEIYSVQASHQKFGPAS